MAYDDRTKDFNTPGKPPKARADCPVCKGVGRLAMDFDMLGNGDHECYGPGCVVNHYEGEQGAQNAAEAWGHPECGPCPDLNVECK